MANQEYKSGDQKFYEFMLKPAIDPLIPYFRAVPGFFKATYGTTATPFRIPTFIRKLKNKQTLVQRQGLKIEHLAGALVAGNYLFYEGAKNVIESTQSGDYLPLAVVIGANIFSGGYEVISGITKHSKQKQSKFEKAIGR